jgi:hypothetical protein
LSIERFRIKLNPDVTYDQIAARKEKAVRFVRDVLDDEDHADDIAEESVGDYAARKKIVITNRAKRLTNERKRDTMANGNGAPTKDDLQDAIDQATQILSEAYAPESSREDLAAAVGDALDVLSGDGGDDDDNGGDDDDDSGVDDDA